VLDCLIQCRVDFLFRDSARRATPVYLVQHTANPLCRYAPRLGVGDLSRRKSHNQHLLIG
jgi:hypothetical protein